VPEWTNGTASKAVRGLNRPSRVRITPPPLNDPPFDVVFWDESFGIEWKSIVEQAWRPAEGGVLFVDTAFRWASPSLTSGSAENDSATMQNVYGPLIQACARETSVVVSAHTVLAVEHAGCCDWDDPPLPGSPHAPFWEARWHVTIEERLARENMDAFEQEQEWRRSDGRWRRRRGELEEAQVHRTERSRGGWLVHEAPLGRYGEYAAVRDGGRTIRFAYNLDDLAQIVGLDEVVGSKERDFRSDADARARAARARPDIAELLTNRLTPEAVTLAKQPKFVLAVPTVPRRSAPNHLAAVLRFTRHARRTPTTPTATIA
jgi:hypothetical protein